MGNKILNHFMNDVDEGLSSHPKALPSKYFYDVEGDRLFQRIMALDEYYLTRAEAAILSQQSDQIVERLGIQKKVNVFELGAGDGTKTMHLLRALVKREVEVVYQPLDISANAIELLRDTLEGHDLSMDFRPHIGLYEEAHEIWSFLSDETNVVLFLGSNMGNMAMEQAGAFLRGFAQKMGADDFFLLGLDAKKDPRQILAAYDDVEGVTAEFNLNLLRRINRELGADFELSKFQHAPMYHPATGEALSYLVSKEDQTVHIRALGKSYHFSAWEAIHTEISRKYDVGAIEKICDMSAWSLVDIFRDEEALFYLCLLAPSKG